MNGEDSVASSREPGLGLHLSLSLLFSLSFNALYGEASVIQGYGDLGMSQRYLSIRLIHFRVLLCLL